MGNQRDTFKYHFKVGNKIVHRGVTNDLDRRENEHKVRWPKGQIIQVGKKTTRESAFAWERSGGKK